MANDLSGGSFGLRLISTHEPAALPSRFMLATLRKCMNNADLQLLDVRALRDDVVLPAAKEIAALLPGDSVLLQASNTRFAVEIRLRRKRHLFTGRVIESTPFLPAGQEISFEPRHIIEVFRYGKH
jgi:hypothetical protein